MHLLMVPQFTNLQELAAYNSTKEPSDQIRDGDSDPFSGSSRVKHEPADCLTEKKLLCQLIGAAFTFFF
jgi:hypothetical protein